jgi:hypothetical protein
VFGCTPKALVESLLAGQAEKGQNIELDMARFTVYNRLPYTALGMQKASSFSLKRCAIRAETYEL